MTRYHAHPRASRPFRDALVVLAEGAAFLFVLAVMASLLWLVTP